MDNEEKSVVFVLRFFGMDASKESVHSSLAKAIVNAGKTDNWMRHHTRWIKAGDGVWKCKSAQNDAVIVRRTVDED